MTSSSPPSTQDGTGIGHREACIADGRRSRTGAGQRTGGAGGRQARGVAIAGVHAGKVVGASRRRRAMTSGYLPAVGGRGRSAGGPRRHHLAGKVRSRTARSAPPFTTQADPAWRRCSGQQPADFAGRPDPCRTHGGRGADTAETTGRRAPLDHRPRPGHRSRNCRSLTRSADPGMAHASRVDQRGRRIYACNSRWKKRPKMGSQWRRRRLSVGRLGLANMPRHWLPRSPPSLSEHEQRFLEASRAQEKGRHYARQKKQATESESGY